LKRAPLKSGLLKALAEHEVLAGRLRLNWNILKQMEINASAVRVRSRVFRRDFPAEDRHIPVYVKIYTYKKHHLQRIARRSKARIEARNLTFFKTIGIPVPEVIGWGLRRNSWGRPVEEFIITRAIDGAQPLDLFIKHACPDRSRPEFARRRDEIIDKISLWAKSLHDHKFFHNDLYWRNIIGCLAGEKTRIYFIDCPAGGFHLLAGQRRHKRVKDLACLDRLARVYCTREERIRFIARYLNCPEHSRKAKSFCQAISIYHQHSLDPDDNPKESMADGII
jgi:tRNA A-37 threonylcarbamoyl transferase component Bud32